MGLLIHSPAMGLSVGVLANAKSAEGVWMALGVLVLAACIYVLAGLIFVDIDDEDDDR